jgi:hypothetical protein
MVIVENSTWLIGNGKSIILWQDYWCGDPLEAALNLNVNNIHHLPLLVNDYILNNHRNIPHDLLSQYPQLRLLVIQVIIHVEDTEDQLVWKHVSNGQLNLKDATHSRNTLL